MKKLIFAFTIGTITTLSMASCSKSCETCTLKSVDLTDPKVFSDVQIKSKTECEAAKKFVGTSNNVKTELTCD
jgi:hypothetical protein